MFEDLIRGFCFYGAPTYYCLLCIYTSGYHYLYRLPLRALYNVSSVFTVSIVAVKTLIFSRQPLCNILLTGLATP